MEAVSPMPATLDQVARAAGVSRATASRVFSGHPRVSEQARRAVESAAMQLGYVPNGATHNLTGGRRDPPRGGRPGPGAGLFARPMMSRPPRGPGGGGSAHRAPLVLFP